MTGRKTIHTRRSIRLQGFDYSKKGLYFITLCTQNRKPLFGEITDGKMELSEAGQIAHNCWIAIPDHFPTVQLEEFVIMPDHVHGIIRIISEVNAHQTEPPKNEYGKLIRGSVGSIVKGFKIGVTKWFREQGNQDKIWQRNYYESVIYSYEDFCRVSRYIIENPKNWRKD